MTTTTLTDYGQVYAEARAEEFTVPKKRRRHWPRGAVELGVALCGAKTLARECTPEEYATLPDCIACALLMGILP